MAHALEDLQNGRMILKKLSVDHGVTIIAATHDRKMIDVSDRVIWIRDGQIEREGKPIDVL